MYFIDDGLAAIPAHVNHMDVISFATEEYLKLGLQVNTLKCHCTRTENVKFMGCTFSRDGIQIPLSKQLLQKNETMLNDIRFMRKNEASRDLCMKFIRNIIVPSINYGAFIDEGAPDVYDDY